MRKRSIALLLVFLAILPSCSLGTDKQPPSTVPTSHQKPSSDACGEVITRGKKSESTTGQRQGASRQARKAIYAFDGELWLYDVVSDSQTRLTRDGGSREELRPSYRNAQAVSFVAQWASSDDEHPFGQDAIYTLSTNSGKTREILRVRGQISAQDWSPDGSKLAYLAGPGRALCLYDTNRNEIIPIRGFSGLGGRGPNQNDEQSVAWSPAGKALLVVDTFLLSPAGPPPTTYVLDLNGRDLVAPFMGTFARWLEDETSILYREFGYGTEGRWFALNTTTGRSRLLGILADTFRPAVTANGVQVAYDDGKAKPSLYVFNIENGSNRRIARGYVAPIWLDSGHVAATAAASCASGSVCDFSPWTQQNATVSVAIQTSARRKLALSTTAPLAYFTNLDVSA